MTHEQQQIEPQSRRPYPAVAKRIQRSGEVDRFLKDIWTRNENIAYAY